MGVIATEMDKRFTIIKLVMTMMMMRRSFLVELTVSRRDMRYKMLCIVLMCPQANPCLVLSKN